MKTKLLAILLLASTLYSFQAIAGDDDDIANIIVNKSGDQNAMKVPEISDADKEASELKATGPKMPSNKKQASAQRDPFQAPAAATATANTPNTAANTSATASTTEGTAGETSGALNSIAPAAGK